MVIRYRYQIKVRCSWCIGINSLQVKKKWKIQNTSHPVKCIYLVHRNWSILAWCHLGQAWCIYHSCNVTHRISRTSILMFIFRHHDIVFDFVQNLTMKGTQKLKLCDRIHFSIVNQHCLCQGTLLNFIHLLTLAITGSRTFCDHSFLFNKCYKKLLQPNVICFLFPTLQVQKSFFFWFAEGWKHHQWMLWPETTKMMFCQTSWLLFLDT